MSNYEFLKYETVENQKYLGICTIRIDRKYIFRYKIVPNKEGNGWFPAVASYNIPKDGKDFYVPAFFPDSNYEKDEIENFIRSGVNKSMADKSKEYAKESTLYPPQSTINSPSMSKPLSYENVSSGDNGDMPF